MWPSQSRRDRCPGGREIRLAESDDLLPPLGTLAFEAQTTRGGLYPAEVLSGSWYYPCREAWVEQPQPSNHGPATASGSLFEDWLAKASLTDTSAGASPPEAHTQRQKREDRKTDSEQLLPWQ